MYSALNKKKLTFITGYTLKQRNIRLMYYTGSTVLKICIARFVKSKNILIFFNTHLDENAFARVTIDTIFIFRRV